MDEYWSATGPEMCMLVGVPSERLDQVPWNTEPSQLCQNQYSNYSLMDNNMIEYGGIQVRGVCVAHTSCPMVVVMRMLPGEAPPFTHGKSFSEYVLWKLCKVAQSRM